LKLSPVIDFAVLDQSVDQFCFLFLLPNNQSIIATNLRQEIELHLFLIPYMFARMRERQATKQSLAYTLESPKKHHTLKQKLTTMAQLLFFRALIRQGDPTHALQHTPYTHHYTH
jgi:hypothetical protein